MSSAGPWAKLYRLLCAKEALVLGNPRGYRLSEREVSALNYLRQRRQRRMERLVA